MNEMTLRVTSADGTRIAYDRKGTGPAVILVGGTLDDGAENAPLARLLANHFTVYNYARRGRGASGNTPPYALARELEDLDAGAEDVLAEPALFIGFAQCRFETLERFTIKFAASAPPFALVKPPPM